ncbi:SDR family oxidoreductase [Halorussus sp. AFM4]|uniref:SDR family oxidoreductase n=1 Tax=Halorussus sp. AFM4 TaxID=3421651 RepID=UPI003EBC2A3D
MSENSLEDHVTLVTGASSGIGRATAHALAERGADVAVSARREERLRELADAVAAEHDAETLVAPADVSEEDEVEDLVASAVDTFGRLDVVVSNAGLGREETVIEELETEAYRQMMDVNCDGMFFLARAAMPHLKQTEGNLIFMASMSGQYPRPASPVYAATKWWTRGLALSLSGSAGPEGVGVTAINPTEVLTEFGSEDGEALGEQLTPEEAATPEDVAEAVAFAAEQDAPNVVQELDFYRRDKFSDW